MLNRAHQNSPPRRSLLPAGFAIILLLAARAAWAEDPPPVEQESPPRGERFIDNGQIRLGVDLGLGGAITYLSLAKEPNNVVNDWDFGRQIQLSFYSGPVPFTLGDKRPAPHWRELGWNPIQAGDLFGHGSRTLDFKSDGTSLYVKCQPMQWPLDDAPGDCTFESWLTLDGAAVRARARLSNARADRRQYPAREQELPAVYTNGPLYRLA